ncbi:hypothetical protein FHR77_002219 [Frigoribacterium endophyticum]|nr:hypothetical protein [Frigoribacterium endophyticum]
MTGSRRRPAAGCPAGGGRPTGRRSPDGAAVARRAGDCATGRRSPDEAAVARRGGSDGPGRSIHSGVEQPPARSARPDPPLHSGVEQRTARAPTAHPLLRSRVERRSACAPAPAAPALALHDRSFHSRVEQRSVRAPTAPPLLHSRVEQRSARAPTALRSSTPEWRSDARGSLRRGTQPWRRGRTTFSHGNHAAARFGGEEVVRRHQARQMLPTTRGHVARHPVFAGEPRRGGVRVRRRGASPPGGRHARRAAPR